MFVYCRFGYLVVWSTIPFSCIWACIVAQSAQAYPKGPDIDMFWLQVTGPSLFVQFYFVVLISTTYLNNPWAKRVWRDQRVIIFHQPASMWAIRYHPGCRVNSPPWDRTTPWLRGRSAPTTSRSCREVFVQIPSHPHTQTWPKCWSIAQCFVFFIFFVHTLTTMHSPCAVCGCVVWIKLYKFVGFLRIAGHRGVDRYAAMKCLVPPPCFNHLLARLWHSQVECEHRCCEENKRCWWFEGGTVLYAIPVWRTMG